MLTNPYYKGNIRYKGVAYDGLHEPLIAPELWYRVQAVLAAHRVSGEKTQTHQHYLKGSLYCGDCGSRVLVSNARSSKNVIYPYFLCAGRHAKRTNCERKSMFVPDIEAAVEDYYRHVQIPEHVVTALRELGASTPELRGVALPVRAANKLAPSAPTPEACCDAVAPQLFSAPAEVNQNPTPEEEPMLLQFTPIAAGALKHFGLPRIIERARRFEPVGRAR